MTDKRTGGDWWPEAECGGRTVHEAEDRAVAKPTGVLTAKGVMIYREPEPLGFRLPHKDRP